MADDRRAPTRALQLRGITAPGEWVGSHINTLPREPIAGEFTFHVELAEIDSAGALRRVLEEISWTGPVPTIATHIFQSHLPDTAPAHYRITIDVHGAGITGSVRSHLTVPPQILDAELIPSRTHVRPGEQLAYTLHNRGPTSLLFGVAYSIDRLVDGEWINANVEEAFVLIGFDLPPGAESSDIVLIAQDAEPGRYRISKDVSAGGTTLSRTVGFAFDVIADRPE